VDAAGNRTVTVSAGDLSTSVVVEGVQPAGQDTPETTTEVPTTAATPTETDTAPGGITPGFGAVTGVLALAALVALALVRARDA
jgi:hypothetical protein